MYLGIYLADSPSLDLIYGAATVSHGSLPLFILHKQGSKSEQCNGNGSLDSAEESEELQLGVRRQWSMVWHVWLLCAYDVGSAAGTPT